MQKDLNVSPLKSHGYPWHDYFIEKGYAQQNYQPTPQLLQSIYRNKRPFTELSTDRFSVSFGNLWLHPVQSHGPGLVYCTSLIRISKTSIARIPITDTRVLKMAAAEYLIR